jgi:hypothetical protein
VKRVNATLLAAFFLFDVSFMVTILLGSTALIIVLAIAAS